MTRPEIVDLTRSHVVDWFGDEGNAPTVKGFAGILDGKVIGIGGLRYVGGNIVAFCDLKDEARPYKFLIAMAGARVVRAAQRQHVRLVAFCDPDEPGAANWLSRLGFAQEEGGVWKWRR